jgi:DNA-binding LacI/PurR family transcriptional regulator
LGATIVPAKRIRTMEEFAVASGVSRPTLSKYFQDPRSVRKSSRVRIEAALERFDYRPNIYAMNQNRRLTRNVGVVVPLLSDPFFGKLARTIERLCAEAGFRSILLSSNGDPLREVENLETLRSLRPAGVLMAPLGRASDRAAVAGFAAEVPTVLVDSELDGVGEAFVGLDVERSVETMVDYLCRSGTPPCLFEMRSPPNPNARRRRAAFEAAMARLGHRPAVVSVAGEGWDFEETGLREGLALLRARALPSSTVLCSNDRLAIGLLAAAYQEGVQVGLREGCTLRVAGIDDHPFARFTGPSLTTVAQDYERIAGRGVDALLAAVERGGGAPPTRPVEAFEGRMVMRASA